MTHEDRFHAGERAVQERVGESALADRNGSVIADRIVAGAIPFLAQQPMVAIGTRKQDGAVWASVLIGERGFVSAPTDRLVRIDASRSLSVPGDPVWEHLAEPAEIGLVALEASTRRRLRVNGRLTRVGDVAEIEVRQAYPNCPKYIQRRRFLGIDPERRPAAVQRGTTLGPREMEMIRRADTLYVATAHDTAGVDCSHRGGSPGFVEVTAPDAIRVPDYAGNGMYNTLGNIELDRRAGIVIVDFDAGEVLQLSGEVSVEWDVRGSDAATIGTRRFWRMTIAAWIRSVLPLRPIWEFIDASPFNPPAGPDAEPSGQRLRS